MDQKEHKLNGKVIDPKRAKAMKTKEPVKGDDICRCGGKDVEGHGKMVEKKTRKPHTEDRPDHVSFAFNRVLYDPGPNHNQERQE